MTLDQFRAEIATLNTWRDGDKRAPHKPLLILYALARFAEGTERLPYNAVEEKLLELLRAFGPPRKKVQAFSFQRLATSALWEVNGAESIRTTASGDWYLTDARRMNPVGRLSGEALQLLRTHPPLLTETAYTLLDAHFPPSLHEDILTSIGLDPESAGDGQKRTHRDPAFREAVLRAYGYRCAVCAFETRVERRLMGVDAAHMKWHSAGGPDDVTNGLALCALHHRLLDGGAYSIRVSEGRRILEVAEAAHGGDGFQRWLLDFHLRPIADPVNHDYRVSDAFVHWHRREVFRKPARS